MLLLACLATRVVAQPSLSVESLGAIPDGNLAWRIDVVADVSLFPSDTGSVLATEIGFELDTGTFVDSTVNDAVWDFANPGWNPFTGSITTGVMLGGSQAFVSLGSDFISESTPVELLTLVTTPEGSGLSWGGHTLLAGTDDEYLGARISQSGQNFDGLSGTAGMGTGVTPGDCNGDGVVDAADLQCACESGSIDDVLAATGLLAGDLDGNGAVEFADFLSLSSNFGGEANYSGGDIDCNGQVAFADFLALSANFGSSSAAAAVPEPTAISLLIFSVATLLLIYRHAFVARINNSRMALAR